MGRMGTRGQVPNINSYLNIIVLKKLVSNTPIITLVFLLFSCSTSKESYQTDNLVISKLTDNTFIHQSYLRTDSYGKVSCNGLVYISGTEAIIFDTPTSDSASVELINWIESENNARVKAVIVTHSHEDCLGGLKAFHQAEIPSFANQLTRQFAEESAETVPTNGFQGELITQLDNDNVISTFLGEGHTKDNIVSYVPAEKVLFGGCLVKELNASEGYVAEGNLNEWSTTVRKVKNRFKDVMYVVPGHGKHGDITLLDYTSELFSQYEKVQ